MRKSRIIRKQENQINDESNVGKKIFLFFVFLVLAVFLGFIIFKMSYQAEKQSGINEEISKLQKQADQLEGENQDLKEIIGYLKTDDFKEKEAKDKLNLIKEGEQMILVKEDSLEDYIGGENEDKKTEIIVHRENYYYWWHYFFSIK